MKFKYFLAFLFLGTSLYPSDSTYTIKVHFLYGSKPKPSTRKTEMKYFGGLHGGHVSIEVDSIEFGFVPGGSRVHLFASKKDIKGIFVDRETNGNLVYPENNKAAVFEIKINEEQYKQLLLIKENYLKTSPYDYAFFGMRCAAATQEILGEIGVLDKRSRCRNIITTFYPKKLRKRMFKLADTKGYKVIKQEGRETRKWEGD
jgi:hypothetical protein